MRCTQSLLLLAAAASVQALSLSDVTKGVSLPSFSDIRRSLPDVYPRSGLKRRDDNCPAVWGKISGQLKTLFLTNGQCNDDARAAIRAAFHDCGSWNKAQGAKGGCDGSLILAGELSRPENNGLQTISQKLLNLARSNNVGVADMLQFAGAHAVATCPLGPQVETFVGRKDSTVPNPDGLLPDARASGDVLFKLFQDKGFDAKELAALLGAHTTAKQRFVDPSRAGQPQDSTPGIWDVKYYGETLNPPAGVFVIPGDKNLATHPTVGKEFRGFVGNQGRWNSDFSKAMTKLSLLGVPGGEDALIDCTDFLPKGTRRRDVRAAGINERAV